MAQIYILNPSGNYVPAKGDALGNPYATITNLSDSLLNTVILNAASTVLSAIPSILGYLQAHTASAGTITITGFLDSAGVAANYVFPVGSLGILVPMGARLKANSGITIALSNAVDYGRVMVGWYPQ